MTFKTYKEAHAALMDADRNRSRVFNRVMDKQCGGRANVDRLTAPEWDRAYHRAQRHPDVREADDVYRAISQYIREHFPNAERRANARLARSMGF